MFEHAIEHITESHLEAAEKLIASMRNDAMIEEWGALNWQFHETLYTPARKPATMKILRRVHDNIDRYVRLQITLTEDSQERAHREHQAIVDAARDKNAKVAVALLNDHINHVKEQLLANLVSKESPE